MTRSELVRRVAEEIELLGYGVSAHPLELLPDAVWRGTVAACDMRRYVGRRVTMIGWLIAAKLLRTHKTREFMKFLSLEDLTDTFEVTLFPRAYSRFAPLTLSPGPFRIRGKIEDEQGAVSLVADHVELLHELHR
jgi:DNA polymerase III alpha subunit